MNQKPGGRGDILMARPGESLAVLKALASSVRLSILELLATTPLNVNEIANRLGLPQSTVATHVIKLQNAGLIRAESKTGVHGIQKICHQVYDEVVIDFSSDRRNQTNSIDVDMPVGLFARFDVAPPCGLCDSNGVIGYFDVPEQFLHPHRIKAGLVWFGRGFLEYQFPNNLLNTSRLLDSLHITAEVSADVPGTDASWETDITLSVNHVELGTYHFHGDFGARRGNLTPRWRPLNTSQYGQLTRWVVDGKGASVQGETLSSVKLSDLGLLDHKSIRVTFTVKDDARHRGGLNIFGGGFGNHDQDIVLQLVFQNDT